MACGTPVLGAAYGGLKDTLKDGQTGFLMPTWATPGGIRTDWISGVENLCTLLTDDKLRTEMGQAAHERAATEYSYDRCARRLRKAVSEAIATRRAGQARPVRTIAPPAPAPSLEILPPVAKPWGAYEAAVRKYVSGPPPAPTPSSRVCTAAPLDTLTDGRVRLQDPAWPATYRLSAADLLAASCCKEPCRVTDLVEETGLTLERMGQLVELGVLICSSDSHRTCQSCPL
jgi:hypothetical protein